MAEGAHASEQRAAALIVAGASAKGPYAAGALSALASHERFARFDIRYLTGASSGSLNAAVFAAGLRCGAEREAAQSLCELWAERAEWHNIITNSQRVAIVKRALERFRGRKREREVKLDVVVASLRGRHDGYGYLRFERNEPFSTEDFESDSGITRLAHVCILSSTIPVIFPPEPYGSEGQFWDGGIVNNTPIGNALKRDRSIDHMIVITPDSPRREDAKVTHGRLALNRLLEMVIEERLSRDLYEAKSFNAELVALERALRPVGLDLTRLGPTIKWKLLQFVELRPAQDLPGTLISGFFSRAARDIYISTGKAVANEALSAWQPTDWAAQPALAPSQPL